MIHAPAHFTSVPADRNPLQPVVDAEAQAQGADGLVDAVETSHLQPHFQARADGDLLAQLELRADSGPEAEHTLADPET